MTIKKEIMPDDSTSGENLCHVVIVVSHIEKRILFYTGILVRQSDWHPLTATVCMTDTDYENKNNEIEYLYRRICGTVQSRIDKILDINFNTLIELNPVGKHACYETEKKHEICLSDVLEAKISIVTSLNTRRGYLSLRNFLKASKLINTDIEYISQSFINRFVEQLESRLKDKTAMKHFLICKLCSTINFGVETGMIPLRSKLRYPKYRVIRKDRNLSVEQLKSIMSKFRELIIDDPLINNKETLAVSIFILDIFFQGLAPVDLALLKVGDIKYLKFDGDPGIRFNEETVAVVVNTIRRKTGSPVRIVCDYENVDMILNPLMRGKGNGDYLLPCFYSNKEYDSSSLQSRLANFFNVMSKYLNRALGFCYFPATDINRASSKLSGEGSSLEFSSVTTPAKNTKISNYYARHAFCNLVDSLDIPRHIIQTMIGHKKTVLETNYLRPLNDLEQFRISRLLRELLVGQ